MSANAQFTHRATKFVANDIKEVPKSDEKGQTDFGFIVAKLLNRRLPPLMKKNFSESQISHVERLSWF